MPIWQLCANLLIPNCLRSNLSYSPLAALELYVSAENLFEFDHTNIPVDPETTEKAAASNGEYKFGKSYPFMRSISFGVQLTF